MCYLNTLINKMNINQVYTQLWVHRRDLYWFYILVYLKHNNDTCLKKKVLLKGNSYSLGQYIHRDSFFPTSRPMHNS